MVTSTDIVNEALQIVGNNQDPVTGVAPNFDSSPAGVAAAAIYGSVVATIARQFNFDFERTTMPLVASGNIAPAPWAHEYLYPANTVDVWQVMPTVIADANNPLPSQWVVANTTIAGIANRVIHTNLSPAQAVVANLPGENVWDALFRQAVVRLLASELATAIAGRPDTSRDMLETSAQFAQAGTNRQG